MKLVSQTFRAALDYLSEFGAEDDVLLFRPLGSEVVISIQGMAYGEYRCQTDAPLQNRFAVPLRIPKRLAREIGDDLLVEFAVGSHLKLFIDRNRFVSPLADLESMPEHPAVNEGITFEWDAKVFVPEIRAAAASVMPGRSGGAMESVNIEVLPARETIVASDGKLLTLYEKKANSRHGGRRGDEVEAKALIHKSCVPLILATCESMGKISLRFGHSKVVVECGRRKTIVPIQEGAFPVWRDQIAAVLNSHPVIGRMECDAVALSRAVRQVKMDTKVDGKVSGPIKVHCSTTEVQLSARSESDNTDSVAVVPLLRRGAGLPKFVVGSRYLISIVEQWPAGVPLVMEYRGALSPLTFIRPRFRAFLMPLLDRATEVERVEEEQGIEV
jgi:hypothetical protein